MEKEKNTGIEDVLATQILALSMVYGLVRATNILKVFVSKKTKETITD